MTNKEWRPPDWANYCGKGFKYGGWTCPNEEIRRVCAGIYEAGANAMLMELESKGEHLEWDSEVLAVNVPSMFKKQFKGTFVFIPEECE